LIKETLSERYGWKPAEIDEMRQEEIDIYVEIIKGKNRKQRDEMEERERKSRTSVRRR